MIKTKKHFGFLCTVIIIAFLIPYGFNFVQAHPHEGIIQTDNHKHIPQTEIIPINEIIGIEKTIIVFHAPKDNTLPWAFVEGKIANHVPDYPVIIQIYDHKGEATHFAQTNVEEDGSYEYRFRVRNVDNGQVINIFEGDYNVKIFKVVYLNTNFSQA